MKKTRLLIGMLVISALAAATVVTYVKRCPVIAWYQKISDRVVATVKGGQTAGETNGTKGLYYCPMHPAFTSDRPGSCSICGMDLVKKNLPANPANQPKPDSSERKVLYYRNPMNPQVTSPVPMKDEMGMDYVPVYEDQTAHAHPGVYISPEKQQLIGVRKGAVQIRRLGGQILTVGRVAYDPTLFTAQQEYLQILKSNAATQKAGLSEANERSLSLRNAAHSKLLLMGMSESEIASMEQRGTAETSLYLPTNEDKSVWVYVTIYEYETALVKEGMPIQVDTPAYPGQTFSGRIVSMTPLLEAATRTFKARALVDNPEDKLKLEMFANIRIDYDLGERLAVPEEGVMHAGMRDIVFVTDSDSFFQPRTVRLGAKAEGWYEVLQGLIAGEQVVTSANFLVDSESKLNAVLNQMTESNQAEGDHRHD